jgi:16S rRNA processing protein RimM
MNHPQLTEIGTIQRTHGVNGELQVNWINNFDPEEHNLESVFLSMDGLPVPFFIQSIRSKGNESSLITLDGIDTVIKAQDLITQKVFAEIKRVEPDSELYLDDLAGFTIVTTLGVQVGIVKQLDDFSGNLVFQVINGAGNEVLIPASPDFILEIDEDTKTLVMDIPEGLSDL